MVTALDWLAWLGLGAVIVGALWVEQRRFGYTWKSLLTIEDKDETT